MKKKNRKHKEKLATSGRSTQERGDAETYQGEAGPGHPAKKNNKKIMYF